MIKITECPRDAMQGIKQQIPTQLKADYINQLLKVGFNTIDFGSFVSPKIIPQMKDTTDVLKKLDLSKSSSKLLAIIANKRGAQNACAFDEISELGFPFSISETFQQRNTNSTIQESFLLLEEIQNLCQIHNKKLRVYLSMAFGNPYGDKWNTDIAIAWCKKIKSLNISEIALSDTIGTSTKESIEILFSAVIKELNSVLIGAHLHSQNNLALEKIKAAFDSGCKSFDVAIHGFGGCPLAKNELIGNIATQQLENFASMAQVELKLKKEELLKSYQMSWDIFNIYH